MEGEVTRESILRLMKSRDEIDSQIEALGGILASVSYYKLKFYA